MSINQNQRVLDHMIDHGYITPLVASSYGIQRLAARIKDLRQEGVRVHADITRNDAGVRYTRYSLMDRGAEQYRRAQGQSWRIVRPDPLAQSAA